MSGFHLSWGAARRRSVLLASALLGLVSASARAEVPQHCYVMPDGRKIPLVRSGSELAVSFRKTMAIGRAARRLAGDGIGVVEDVPGAKYSRHKLLRVADTTARRRNLAASDPEIESVRPVYWMEGVSEPYFSTGTIVARVAEALDGAEIEALWARHGLIVVEPVEGLPGVYCVKPVLDGGDEVLIAEVLASDPQVVWSQPNFRQRLVRHQAIPDEFFPQQWHLNNTGQLGGLAGADISVLEAWNLSQGANVKFGMFDDACDVDHVDLFENYLGVGQDPSLQESDDDSSNPRPKQFGDKHGTPVMGLAVARANTFGVRGVSFLSQFTVSRGLGEMLTNQEIAKVYTFARQQELDVHINSWGFPDGTPNPAIVVDAIGTAFREGRDPDGEEGDDEPLGMVVVFAAGDGSDEDGVAREVGAGEDLAALSTVIAVGATDISDRVTSASNFGEEIDVVAPGGDNTVGLATVDNDDETVFVDDGFNINGFSSLGAVDLDTDGRYTSSFSGTSAACPVVAGVAGLILSANPLLTATDVRIILEHTADRVSSEDAAYGNITSRSEKYGQGRVNAATAVRAAIDALPRNLGQTWPDRVVNPRIDETTLRWDAPVGAREFLIVESSGGFSFVNTEQTRFPSDGVCYSNEQLGCRAIGETELGVLPPGVTLTTIRTCDGDCDKSEEEFTLDNVVPGGAVSYAVYARSGIGRYSWGAEATLVTRGADTGPVAGLGPKVTISASVVQGTSPLTVFFNGNAQSTTVDIDVSRTVWDFNVFDASTNDANTSSASHTYVVPAGATQTFIARLTIFDVEGNPGSAQVSIQVEGAGAGDLGTPGATDVRIIVGIPGNADADINGGISPFDVLLTVNASALSGTLSSVEWDLGDGTTAASLVVPHTYINDTNVTLRMPIIATVTTRTTSATTQTFSATRVIEVQPGLPPVVVPDVVFEGVGVPGASGSTTCGAFGMLPLLFFFGTLAWWRR